MSEGDMRARRCIRPGYLSRQVKSDDRRMEFDCKNEVLIRKEIPVDLLFIGDSITQMWELSAYFHSTGLRMINRGIGGDRTEYLLHRFYADAVQLKPRFTVLMAGINDAWELEADAWKQESGKPLKEVLEHALANMDRVLDIAADHRMRMAVCSILPTCMRFTGQEKARQEYVKRYNEGLKELAKRHQMCFVDYYPAFVSEDGCSMRESLTADGLHPNVYGYDRMAQILASCLEQEGVVPNGNP
ncbi:SGNH/GDSL hydrolase family protein [Lachnotalea sp. AF33-28]|uniref:SGNH/GDSL hydrolase family protein n=1 Tax=Lachnotalea sp. AF33-28 TaxID=2292046 RepID=UPI000E4BD9E3|nr:GDSL-type esterase/lipase family protein [Lachnotalea sp. AF33-28]RHP31037.1 G-D-S-L family lipolytic protein [Lachnotalea sp. AF33-28]